MRFLALLLLIVLVSCVFSLPHNVSYAEDETTINPQATCLSGFLMVLTGFVVSAGTASYACHKDISSCFSRLATGCKMGFQDVEYNGIKCCAYIGIKRGSDPMHGFMNLGTFVQNFRAQINQNYIKPYVQISDFRNSITIGMAAGCYGYQDNAINTCTQWALKNEELDYSGWGQYVGTSTGTIGATIYN